ncbi:PREDICTED: ubiquitin-conjugating enzyme E2 J1-like [Branchiostoma belcheri]|uniref:Ubiquitin-conjugating enzyme E2 J1 n=1 Tax=Branchiostoma belcheri TaxID=7741 RepID=A0A6P4YND3_BRABE|nr:PREDICTED: ubiquitin-conjugating enzyme E2 J1-like [Branchiostoma belcheri]
MEGRYNMKSPAVKRLMREAKEMHEPTEQYYAQPLEDNLFEWHFTVRGPPDSDFQGGMYHGRITLPPEYPMKPPSIMLLTPNGRFETGKKICLSISGHHPETWQPSWSIRTVLLAIIGFMPTKGAGAIGSLDYTPEERKILARKSLEWKCDACGTTNKTMLKPPSNHPTDADREAQELASQISFKGEAEKGKDQSAAGNTSTAQTTPADPTTQGAATSSSQGATGTQAPPGNPVPPMFPYMVPPPYAMYAAGYPNAMQQMGGAAAPPQSADGTAAPQPTPASPSNTNPSSQQSAATPPAQARTSVRQRAVHATNNPASGPTRQLPRQQPVSAGSCSLFLMVVLTLSIAFLILRRVYLTNMWRWDYEL